MNEERHGTKLEERVEYYKENPEEIPGYQVVEGLAAGYFSAVLLATDKHGRKRAIKDAWDKRHDEAFKEIGRQYKKLGNSCEQIVGYVENAGRDNEKIVLEYCEWPTLKEILADRKTLPVEDVLQITREVLYALKYAHERGVFHGDVKPSNIKVGSHNQVKLLDFYHAVLVEEDGLTKGAVVEKPAYYGIDDKDVIGYDHRYSPIYLILDKGKPNAYSDIFQLTKSVHEMLFGFPNITGPSECVRLDDPIGDEAKKIVDTILVRGTITIRAEEFENIEKLVEQHHGFQSAEEMLVLVRKALGDEKYVKFDSVYSKFADTIERGRDMELGVNTNLLEVWKVYSQLESFATEDPQIKGRIESALKKVEKDIVVTGFDRIYDFWSRWGKPRQGKWPMEAEPTRKIYEKWTQDWHKAPESLKTQFGHTYVHNWDIGKDHPDLKVTILQKKK